MTWQHGTSYILMPTYTHILIYSKSTDIKIWKRNTVQLCIVLACSEGVNEQKCNSKNEKLPNPFPQSASEVAEQQRCFSFLYSTYEHLTGRNSFCMYFIQYCFVCRLSDSTVSEDDWIEPRTVTTLALALRCSNHSVIDLIPNSDG